MRVSKNLTISFGLVNIPVGLTPLVRSDYTKVRGAMYCQEHETRLKRPYHCEDCGGQPQATVTGYEAPNGAAVFLDLGSLANERDKTIHVDSFVPVGNVDPLYYDKSYVVVPPKLPKAAESLAMLGLALEDTDLAAVGSVVLDKSRQPVLLRYSTDARCLILHTLHYHEAIRWDSADEAAIQVLAGSFDAEVEQAKEILVNGTEQFNPSQYSDTFSDHVRAEIEARSRGLEPAAPEPEPIPDLIGDLKATLDAKQPKRKTPANKAKRGSVKRG